MLFSSSANTTPCRHDPLFAGAAPLAGRARVRIAGKVEESIVDGPGLRYVLFTQGCPHHCPGCHNPATHAVSGGVEVSLDDILRDIRTNSITRGVTFSGGEPFLQSETLAPLAAELKRQGYHLMAYTGYLMEELLARPRHWQASTWWWTVPLCWSGALWI